MSITSYTKNVPPLSARTPASLPAIRHITFGDLTDALRMGWEDFKTVPTHAVMLALIIRSSVLLWRVWCWATPSSR